MYTAGDEMECFVTFLLENQIFDIYYEPFFLYHSFLKGLYWNIFIKSTINGTARIFVFWGKSVLVLRNHRVSVLFIYLLQCVTTLNFQLYHITYEMKTHRVRT
jgi:hypothetical protein